MKTAIYVTIFFLLIFQSAFALKISPFQYKVAIIGHPSNPDTIYTEGRMKELKRLGFNTIQLNIAWGRRPAGEPLNLENILYIQGVGSKETVEKSLSSIKFRAKMAKKWGFRTIFHFGAPRIEQIGRAHV